MEKNDKAQSGKTKEFCDFCEGTLYSETVPVEIRNKGNLIIIEDVPAEVCNRCGQKSFTAEADANIEKILKTKPHADRTITVPVFKWNAVEADYA